MSIVFKNPPVSEEEKESAAQQDRQAYKVRIDALRAAAALDGLEVNEASERDFWSFIGSPRFSRRASLALMDNGNLRAVWKGEDASHLGLHFLGEQQVQYVIFKRRFRQQEDLTGRWD